MKKYTVQGILKKSGYFRTEIDLDSQSFTISKKKSWNREVQTLVKSDQFLYICIALESWVSGLKIRRGG